MVGASHLCRRVIFSEDFDYTLHCREKGAEERAMYHKLEALHVARLPDGFEKEII
jgi:hypothetical protein